VRSQGTASTAFCWIWTVLLVWAARHPEVQRGVIGFTLVPVIAGLIVSELLAIRAGFVRLANVAPLLGMQGALLAFGAWCLRDGPPHR
jgi:hypothetical protein